MAPYCAIGHSGYACYGSDGDTAEAFEHETNDFVNIPPFPWLRFDCSVESML